MCDITAYQLLTYIVASSWAAPSTHARTSMPAPSKAGPVLRGPDILPEIAIRLKKALSETRNSKVTRNHPAQQSTKPPSIHIHKATNNFTHVPKHQASKPWQVVEHGMLQQKPCREGQLSEVNRESHHKTLS